MEGQEFPGITGEDGEAQAEAELRVGMAEGGEEPFAKEAGAAGKEEAFAAQFREFRGRPEQDVVEIGGWDGKKSFFRLAHTTKRGLLYF
jgi:hypothetical protein